jgi:uncharacterized protein YjiS (DUF1127 family)
MSTFSTTRGDLTLRSTGSRGSFLLRVVSMIEGAMERRRSRVSLMELSDAQLKDIGISRSEAYREANRPFWD